MPTRQTVFISYRHTNVYHARAIYQALTVRGFDVFLSIEPPDSTITEQIMHNQIAARVHFLLLLTPSALDAGSEPDWVRRAIEHALDLSRLIVPLMFEEFAFSGVEAKLTGKLAALKDLPGVAMVDSVDHAVEQLIEQFLSGALDFELQPAVFEDMPAVEQRQAETQQVPTPTPEQLQAEQVFEQGVCLYQTDHEQALSFFDETIQLNPQFVSAYNYRGVTRHWLGDPDGAIADYAQALQLNPADAITFHLRGYARFAQDDFAGAIADYDEAIRLKPETPIYYFNRANSRKKLSDLDGAIADFSEAIRLNPQYANAYAYRSMMWIDLKKFENAQADLNETLRLEPEHFEYLILRGLARVALGNLDGALADFNAASQLDSQHFTVYQLRGRVRYRQGDYAQAIADFSVSLDRNPECAATFYHRGLAWCKLGNFEEAVRDFESALHLTPDDQDVRRALRRALNMQEAGWVGRLLTRKKRRGAN